MSDTPTEPTTVTLPAPAAQPGEQFDPRNREEITNLYHYLGKVLDESTPLSIARKERDQALRSWDKTRTEILENLTHIRYDYEEMRRKLKSAGERSTADTDRLISALEQSRKEEATDTNQLTAVINLRAKEIKEQIEFRALQLLDEIRKLKPPTAKPYPLPPKPKRKPAPVYKQTRGR